MTQQELLDRRRALTAAMRAVLDSAESEQRELTSEENREFGRNELEVRRIDTQLAELGENGSAGGGEPRGVAGASDAEFVGVDAGTAGAGRAQLTLGREERMSDWQARRPGAGRRSSFTVEEAREFSLGRLIQGMVRGNWGDAELERRALGEGSDSAGGVLVPELIASFVIDRARNQARVLEAGAVVVPMDSDDVSIPRLATGATGGWRAEHAPVTESDPVFERVRLVAKTAAVLTRLSWELFEDLTPQAADTIANELTQAIALQLDLAALRGSGVNPEPRGLRNTTGVTIQSLGANGATPSTYAALIDAAAAVLAANFTPNAAIYAARTAAMFAKLTDSTGQPLQRPPLLAGLTELVSNQIPVNLAQGTSNDTSELYVGQWDQLLIGVRPSLAIRVVKLDQTFAASMQVGLIAYLRADVAVAHPAAFAITTGVRP